MSKLVGNKHVPEDSKSVHEYVDQPKIVPKDYKTAVVDNRHERLDTLVQYADGAKLKVAYFKQRLSRDDSVSHFSLDLPAPLQQYERIDGLEILLQGSMNNSQNTDGTKNTEITGEAHIRPPIIPNVGDVFLADFGRGTLGWFNITSVRRLSHRRNTLYEVSYSMAYEITDQVNDKRIVNLNSKVVEVFKYSEDFLQRGLNPLLTPKQADRYEYLGKEYHRLVRYWFKKFHSRYYESCLIPNQSVLTYDGFFMRAIAKLFDTSNAKEMVYFRLYNDDEFPVLRTTSIWDALVEHDINLLEESFTEACKISVKDFSLEPTHSMIRYSAFSAIVGPIQFAYDNNIYIKNDWEIAKAGLITNSVQKQRMTSVEDIPLIHQILMKHSYVFSKAFYQNDPQGMSHLEIQLRNYFEEDIIRLDILEALVKDYKNWGELEQYYYTPVLLVLIDYGIRKV